jgi:hypothetical protein
MRDTTAAQRRPVGPRAVGLVAAQVIQSLTTTHSWLQPGHVDLVQQRNQQLGVVGLPAGKPAGQVTAPPFTDRVNLGGEPAAGLA